jgi:PAS domain S-box-containing protein
MVMDLSQMHQIVLESMSEAVYIRDLDMNILYVNPAAERLVAYSREEAKGRKCDQVFGDEPARCREVCPAEKVIAEGVHMLHHEGRYSHNSEEPSQLSSGPAH